MARDRSIQRVDGIGRRSLPGTLTRLMELTSDGVVVLDGGGVVIHANERASRLLCDGEDCSGRPVADLLSACDEAHTTPGELPFPCDGTRVAVATRASKAPVRLLARCDTVSAPGTTLLLVLSPLPDAAPSSLDRDGLMGELSRANRRLTGILRIVLGTIDTQDMAVLLDRVLEELASTMGADGSVCYLAASDGFRLRGVTGSMEGERVPNYLAFGRGIETMAVTAGHALRLHVVAPTPEELRRGRLATRLVADEETGERRRVDAAMLPPFSSAICLPVWFGGHVIALIMVGWAAPRPLSRDDARLLDAVGQYLSTQLMGAITSLRAQRSADLDHASAVLHDELAALDELTDDNVLAAVGHAFAALGSTLVRVAVEKDGELVALPGRAGDGLDEVGLGVTAELACGPAMEEGVGVVDVSPFSGATTVSDALEAAQLPCVGALLALEGIGGSWGSSAASDSPVGRTGARTPSGATSRPDVECVLELREAESEPADDIELAFVRRVGEIVRDAVFGQRSRRQDKRIAQALQLGMRNELQEVPGIDADAIYSSATAEAFVGGDFYDLIRLPGRRACVIMGDVSGKGVEAASVSAAVKTALGAYAWQGISPARMVRTLNRFLLGFSRLETFATMFVGVVDLDTLTLTYCSAGHPPALLVRSGGRVLELLDVQSGVVGAFEEMRYRDGRVALAAGDTLLLYTDGTTEARDPAGAFFGERGLREAVLAECAAGVPDDLLDRLLGRLDAFTARNLEDDVAMVRLTFAAEKDAASRPFSA